MATSMSRLSLPKSRLVRTPIRLVILLVVTIGTLHTLSRSNNLNWTGTWTATPARLLSTPPPPDISPVISHPVLVSRLNSDNSPFTSYTHQHPYPGTAHHMTTTIHPSKDNETHYLLTSLWYFEQEGNLDWMKLGVQGSLPTSAHHLDFTCAYRQSGNGERIELPAITNLQSRKEYVRVECPLPPWIKIDNTMSDQKIRQLLGSFSKDTTRVKAWMQLDAKEEHTDPWRTWRNKTQSPDAVIRQQFGSTYVHLATHELAAGDWGPSGPPNKLAICLSPVRLHEPESPNSPKLVSQLKDMIEWRVWHAFGGVDAVHWTARDGNLGNWVKALNRVLGLHDTFLTAPNPTTAPGNKILYSDQLMYLADCFMRYGVSDEWQAMTDLDEYLLARNDPRPHWITRRLDHLPKTVATLGTEQMYRGKNRIDTSQVHVDEFPSFPRNNYLDWDTTESFKGFRLHKSLHRTAGVHDIWVHSVTAIGEGYWRTDDKPEVTPDKADHPSQLELLHDRGELPAQLVIKQTVAEGTWDAWPSLWEQMAEVLRRPELAELWDPELIAPIEA